MRIIPTGFLLFEYESGIRFPELVAYQIPSCSIKNDDWISIVPVSVTGSILSQMRIFSHLWRYHRPIFVIPVSVFHHSVSTVSACSHDRRLFFATIAVSHFSI